jgi:hypothetical protein
VRTSASCACAALSLVRSRIWIWGIRVSVSVGREGGEGDEVVGCGWGEVGRRSIRGDGKAGKAEVWEGGEVWERGEIGGMRREEGIRSKRATTRRDATRLPLPHPSIPTPIHRTKKNNSPPDPQLLIRA